MEIDNQVKEQDLAPQFQIQRLTAQLTAAHNRIAALEEQLLTKRWKRSRINTEIGRSLHKTRHLES